MKKYILNLFLSEANNAIPEVRELAALIGFYNQDQPENEFINWLINNLSGKYFIFTPVGKETSGGPHTYDIQYWDEHKRVGTIEVAFM